MKSVRCPLSYYSLANAFIAKGINISYFKISRRRKTQKKPAPQKRLVKRRNLEQLHEDEAPAAHSAVSTSKRRRSKSPNEEGNTLIPDPAQLPDKSNTQAIFHPQPPTASVPEDTQCNGQKGPPPPSNDASIHMLAQQHPQPPTASVSGDTQCNQTGPPPPSNDASIHIHTLAQQHPQQFTKTGIFNTRPGENPANMPQAGSRVIDFNFENLNVGDIQNPPRVTGFQRPSGITEFDFEDLGIGVIQPRATDFQIDNSDDSVQHPSGLIDFQFESLGDCRFQFGGLDAQFLQRTDFGFEEPGGVGIHSMLLTFPAQQMVEGTQQP